MTTMKKPRVLFVDDDEVVVRFLKRVLLKSSVQWDMDFLNSVDQALEKLKDTHYDVLVSDLKMPDKSGFDFLSILQKNECLRHLPVILLTGFEEANLKRKALEYGAIDLLPKPVEVEDLVARINSVLRLKTYHNELQQSNRYLQEQLTQKQKLELLGKLAIGAFHDLNNMLTIISGYSQMIRFEPDFVEKNMNQITDTCCQASEFTKQILEFARSTSEVREKAYLGKIIGTAVDFLRRCIPKQIEIEWVRPTNLSQIWVNEPQIIQLLMDLGLNISLGITGCGTITVNLTEIEYPEVSKRGKQDFIPPGLYQRTVLTDTESAELNKTLERSAIPTSLPTWNQSNPNMNLRVSEAIVKKHSGFLRGIKPRRGGTYLCVYLPVE